MDNEKWTDVAEFLNDIETSAYKRGRDHTRKEAQAMIDSAYQKGLEEAWRCARRITSSISDGGFTTSQLDTIFGNSTIAYPFACCTAVEAIKKIKEWDESLNRKEDITVGDIVYEHRGGEFVVTCDYGADVIGITPQGYHVKREAKCNLKKTGKRMDIKSLLNDLRERIYDEQAN